MTGGWSSLVSRFRQDEYTGEQRCWPCTLVNVVIAIVLAGILAVGWMPLGIAVLLASLAVIYLRGYLVPGTPALTRRYLPTRIHRLFGKDPTEDIAAPADDDLAVALNLRARRGDGDEE